MYAQKENVTENSIRAVGCLTGQNTGYESQGVCFKDNRAGTNPKIQSPASGFAGAIPMGNANQRAARPVNPTPITTTGARIIQRTLLSDIDDKIFKKYISEKYESARNTADDAEILFSTLRLSKFYGMRPRSIKTATKINTKETLILVGHGGGGTFMSMPPKQLIERLIQLGLENGMQVVLAGCETSQATPVIKGIKAITNHDPIVNKDLAFTSKTGEFTVSKNDSLQLYNQRNKALKKIDFEFMIQQKMLVSQLIDSLSNENFDQRVRGLLKAFKTVRSNVENQTKGLSKKQEKRVAAFKGFFNNFLTKSVITSDNPKKVLPKLMKVSNALAFTDQTFGETHKKLILTFNRKAVMLQNEHIEKIKTQLSGKITLIHYPIEVAKKGGALPLALRRAVVLEQLVRTKLANQKKVGATLFGFLGWDAQIKHLEQAMGISDLFSYLASKK